MFGDDFNAEDMQAARLEAARRVRDWYEAEISSILAHVGRVQGDYGVTYTALDDAALARIIGDAPAGEGHED